MKKLLLPIFIVTLMMSVGCATDQNRPSYIYQDYSESLYAIKKSPSGESVAKHREVLLSIIEESKAENVRVPPGVYCEYGYLLLVDGKKEEAFKYFDLEQFTYPESKVFVENLKAYVTKTTKKDADRAIEVNKDANNANTDNESKKDAGKDDAK
jgi:hypothetical protein